MKKTIALQNDTSLQPEAESNLCDFTHWILQQPPACHFLVVLSPLIKVMLNKLEEKRVILPALSQIFLFSTLRTNFYRDVQQHWAPKFLRAGVVELHASREKGLLLADTAAARFHCFIRLLGQPQNSAQFMKKYVVLNDQLIIFEKQYIKTFNTLLERLEDNWDHLVKTYFPEANPMGNISLEQINRSGDVHAGGHAVKILTFTVNALQKKIVYKPRSLAIDLAYYEAIRWLNYKTTLNFYIPSITSRNDYGFYEFITHQSCETLSDLTDYYKRLGGLTALLHALLGCDIHVENIIAQGAQPVVIDLECLLQPGITSTYRSIIDIGILPRQLFVNKTFGGIDLSALGAHLKQPLMQTVLRPVRPGFDDMTVERVTETLMISLCLPTLSETSSEIEFIREFTQGFQEIFNAIAAAPEDFIESIRPYLSETKTRSVFRSTYDYSKLLLESYYPSLLMSRTGYRKHFNWLYANSNSLQKPLVAYEIADLMTGNIPLFTHRSTDAFISDAAANRVPLNIAQTGLSRWISHVKMDFTPQKSKLHLTLIDQAFCAYRLNQNKPTPISECKNRISSEDTLSFRMYKKINQLLEKLISLAVIYQGKVLWPTITRTPNQVWQVNWVKDPAFYQELMGVVICLTYSLHHFPLNKSLYLSSQQLILQALNSITLQLKETPLKTIGWFDGWGGLITGLNLLTPYYPNKNLLSEWLLQFERAIETTGEVDMVCGLAGGLVALLSMEQTSLKIKQLTQRVFAKLIQLYPVPDQFPEHLAIISEKPLVGYSHGTSGITVALWIYALRYSDKQAQKWVQQALNYERSVFSHQHQNWPDFRKRSVLNHQEYAMTAWCHGAAGVLLARMQLHQNGYRDAFILQEIAIGLQATLQHGFSGFMNLCHGDIGNLDILLYACQHGFLPYPIYEEKLQHILNQLETSHFETEPGINVFTAGLMTGQTGILYQLLRCLQPEIIPSVLAIG